MGSRLGHQGSLIFLMFHNNVLCTFMLVPFFDLSSLLPLCSLLSEGLDVTIFTVQICGFSFFGTIYFG